MPRLLSTVLVLGLLGGTAAAFAITERLKLVPSPIIAPKVTAAFSPTCRCETATALIELRLRSADRISVSVVDADGDEVAGLVEDEERSPGMVRYGWDGRGAEEGLYRVRVHLDRARRTIVIPNTIRLDTTAPRLEVESIAPAVFSPDGDGRADKVSARFRVDEEARVRLLVDGRQTIVTPPRRTGKIDWYATRGVRPGAHDVRLVATDLAGNVSSPSPPTTVRLRFIRITPRRLRVPAGFRFGIRVSTEARRYRWRLGRRTGASRARTLVLRAPQQPGRYTLTLSYGRYRDAVPVFVRPAP